MKNLLKLTVVLLLTFNFGLLTIQAQTPNEFKYQAVLRDASGAIMASEAVTVDISILQGSATGTSVFTEQHSVTTTAQGLINLNIGSVEDLSVVDFSSDIYFIEITVNDVTMGTSQLLSVPYALQSKTAETADYNNLTNLPILFDGDYNSLDNLPTLSITDWNTAFSWGDHSTVGYLTSYTETDPTFTAWDKSTGISITESQISDLGTYLTSYTETDPTFTAWDKSTGISITESQISDFGTYLTSFTETDPTFTAWDKDYTDLINTPANLSDFNNDLSLFDGNYSSLSGAPTNVSSFTNDAGYLVSETDGDATNELEMPSDAANGDMAFYNGTAWEKITAPGQYSMVLTYCDGAPTWTSNGECPLKIGDSYQGGIVGYILQNGDAGYDANQQHGIVVQTSYAVNPSGLCSPEAFIMGGNTASTSDAIGEGLNNTNNLYAAGNTSGDVIAFAYNYSDGTYDDWFVPSKNELFEILTNVGSTIAPWTGYRIRTSTEIPTSLSQSDSYYYSNGSVGYGPQNDAGCGKLLLCRYF